MIYILYLILLVILLAVESKSRADNKIRWIVPILYILFIGCRGANVGVDTPSYYNHYYEYGELGCDYIEVGFDWINRLCYALGFSQAPFFVICAAIPILFVTIMAGKSLSRKEYSLFMLLFCTTTFVSFCNGMRQNIACGIFFALILFLNDDTIKKRKAALFFIIGLLLSSLFHVSVLFMLPVFFIRNLRIPNSIFAIVYLLSFIFVFYNVSNYFPAIELGERDYGRFLGGDLTNQKASSLGFIVITCRNILLMLIMFGIKAYKRQPLLSNMTLMFLVMTNLGFNIPIISRVNMYFSFFYIMLLSLIFADYRHFKNNVVKVLTPVLILIVIVLTVYSVVSPSNMLTPYTFCWENSNYSKFLYY